jgi:hypothetical protein
MRFLWTELDVLHLRRELVVILVYDRKSFLSRGDPLFPRTGA